MALIKISQLPIGDSNISSGDMLPFVNHETLQTQRLTVQGLEDYLNVAGIVDSAIAEFDQSGDGSDHDSARTQGQIDSAVGALTTSDIPEASNLYYTDARVTALVDSAYVSARVEAALTLDVLDSAEAIQLINETVDSAYVNALVDFPGGLDGHDSALVQGQMDSEFNNRFDQGLATGAEVSFQKVETPTLTSPSGTNLNIQYGGSTRIRMGSGSMEIFETANYNSSVASFVEANGGANALIHKGYVDTEHSALQSSMDSNRTESLAGDATLRQRLDELTTDSVAEGSNLYYTDARVDARVGTTIDSDFLDGRMPIDNLSDVQINSPTLSAGDVLEWNGSVWSNREMGITSTVVFRGTVDATTETAPSATNGDFYINTVSGTADASWSGLSSVDSGDGLVWDSDDTNWRNVGGISSGAIVRVQAGTAIEVDETDPVRPVVAVRKDITDTWYYTQAQIDSAADSARAQNVSENTALQASIDSEHSWNVSEHNALQASIDSEHAFNVAEHAALQASIDSVGASAFVYDSALVLGQINSVDPLKRQAFNFNNEGDLRYQQYTSYLSDDGQYRGVKIGTVAATGFDEGTSVIHAETPAGVFMFNDFGVMLQEADLIVRTPNSPTARKASATGFWKISGMSLLGDSATIGTISVDSASINKLTVGPDSADDAKLYFETGADTHVLEGREEGAIDMNAWLTQNTGSGLQRSNVAAANGVFLSFSHQDIIYSEDAVNWNVSEATPSNETFVGAHYDGSKWVAVSRVGYGSGANVWTSTDNGLTWSSTPLTAQMYKKYVYANNTHMVIADETTYGDGQNQIGYSSDAVNWTFLDAPTNSRWTSIAYGTNNTWMALATDGSTAVSTDNGATWSSATSLGTQGTGGWWADIAYGNGVWVVVHNQNGTSSGAPHTHVGKYSTDNGATWSSMDMMFAKSDMHNGWHCVEFADGKFVAVSGSGLLTARPPRQCYSYNGIDWVASNSSYDPNNTLWTDLAYGNGKFIACGGAGGLKIMTLDHDADKAGLWYDGSLVATRENLTPLIDKINELTEETAADAATLDFSNLPDSAGGLASGKLYRDSDTIRVVL